MRIPLLILAASLAMPATAAASTEGCRLVQAMQRTESGLVALVTGTEPAPSLSDVAQGLARLRQAAPEGGGDTGSPAALGADAGATSAPMIAAFVAPREAVLSAILRGEMPEARARMNGLDIWTTATRLTALAERFDCTDDRLDPAETAWTGQAAPAFAATSAAPDGAQRPQTGPTPTAPARGGLEPNAPGRSAGWPAAPPDALSPRPGLPPAPTPDVRLFLQALSVFLLAFAASATVINRLRRLRRRRARRFPCRLDVAVFEGPRPRLARLVDVSRLGGKLRIMPAPAPGQRLSLRAPALDVDARVVWATTHYAWVAFRRPMGRRSFARLMLGAQIGSPARKEAEADPDGAPLVPRVA